jgi:predicted AAA+ superfamily ATPase
MRSNLQGVFMFKRLQYFQEIEQHFRIHSICCLLGPRQVGKSTLARQFIQEKTPQEFRFFDLENPTDLARLENPMLTLSAEPNKLIVIDEIQMRPELFPVLRVLVDDPQYRRKFLILGSASRDLIRQSSETLAGRIGYIEMYPFSLSEVLDLNRLWLRGGFPLSYLANSEAESMLWRQNYITTFLERDIPNLGFAIPPQSLRRFWLMLTHGHGQIFNASAIAKSLAISDHTSRKYLDILAGTFMIRILSPWFESVAKRQVKSPKIYFRDSGILHALLNLQEADQLYNYPKLGAFWEDFALEELIKTHKLQAEECFFWSTQADAELDLLLFRRGKRLGFEFKYSDTPKITKSMRIALVDLKLDHLYVIHPQNITFPLADNITAQGVETIASLPL